MFTTLTLRNKQDALGKRKERIAEVLATIRTDKTKLGTNLSPHLTLEVAKANFNSASFKQKLEEYESRPSPDEERERCNAIVEKTVKERTKMLAEFVVSLEPWHDPDRRDN